MTLDPPGDLKDVFEHFSSADLEELASFVRNVEEIQRSRFGQNLDRLGQAPTIKELHRHPGGGGAGLINVKSAHPEARSAILMVTRRLRSESDYGSLHRACSILKGSTKRRDTDRSTCLGYRIEAARRSSRLDSAAIVGASVQDANERREYRTRAEIIELMQYGHHFHQGRDDLRRDWLVLPEALLEPSIDDALRAVAEAALAVYPLALAVIEDSSLLRR